MTALALALALAAAGPGVRTQLPPAPVRLYHVVWQRPLVSARPLEVKPQELGGIAADPQRGLAFLGTRDGWLHAVRADGTIAWEFRARAGFGSPSVDGDTVYAGSTDGTLYAIAIPTGKPRWTYFANEDLSTRPAVAGGVVLVASLQDTVFAIDAATGAWKWHHRREQKGESLTIFGAASVQVSGPTGAPGRARRHPPRRRLPRARRGPALRRRVLRRGARARGADGADGLDVRRTRRGACRARSRRGRGSDRDERGRALARERRGALDHGARRIAGGRPRARRQVAPRPGGRRRPPLARGRDRPDLASVRAGERRLRRAGGREN